MFGKKAMIAALSATLAFGSLFPMSALAADKAAVESERFFAEITMDHSMVSLAPGQHIRLVATAKLPSGVNGEVKWQSNNSAVASVNSDGLIYALSTGDAIVTASIGDIAVECRVEVTIDPIPYDGHQTAAVRKGYTAIEADVEEVEATEEDATEEADADKAATEEDAADKDATEDDSADKDTAGE